MRCLSRWTCVLMVVVAATVFAQQIAGNIRGTVVDASGAVVQTAAAEAAMSVAFTARLKLNRCKATIFKAVAEYCS
jgi:hypothetical protein